MSRVTLSEETPCPVCGCQGQEAQLARERDLAVAHDRQPYPTAEAYERVCALLEERKDEAARLRAILQSCESVGVELTWHPGRIQATARNARADALGEKYRESEAKREHEQRARVERYELLERLVATAPETWRAKAEALRQRCADAAYGWAEDRLDDPPGDPAEARATVLAVPLEEA